MSGKRQHFIPRFLQEGFASHKVGDQIFTWVYRKDSPPFSANIINVGVESQFYTDGADTLADDLITKAEGQLSETVQELRNTGQGYASNPRVPELVAHLEVRTRHIRQSFMQTSDYLVSRLFDYIEDQEFLVKYLERKLQSDPSLLRESFSRKFLEQGIPTSMLEPAMKMAKPLVPIFMAKMKPMIPIMAEQLHRVIREKMPESAKSGHIRALKQSQQPELKIERYKELNYHILSVDDGSLILGDSAVLFMVTGPRPYKAFLEKDDVLRFIFLPLTPQSLLVGSYDNERPAIAELRQALARCSLEYFIAHENSDENRLLKEQIGEDAYPLTVEQMEEIIDEVMNE